MKERELRARAQCDYCRKQIGESGIPGFHTVELVSYKLNEDAIKRQTGFGMMMGAQLAMVMGADEDLAIEFERQKTTMCWSCWVEKMPEPIPEEAPNVEATE